MTRPFLLLAALLVLCSPALAGEPSVLPPQTSAASPITSADRRFRVRGPSSAGNLRTAEALSRLSRDLETILPSPIPFPRGHTPISVHIPAEVLPADAPSAAAPASFTALQNWSDSEFVQRLLAPPSPDPEDLRARVVSLLLTRCASFAAPPRSPAHRAAAPPPPPDWLSVGLAQLLDPATLRRDQSWLSRATAPPPPLAEVLSWNHLPDGPTPFVAYAAAAAALAFPPDDPATPARFLDAFRAAAASPSPLPPSWFLAHTALPSPENWPDALARFAAPASSTLPDLFHAEDPDASAEARLVQTLTIAPADWLPPSQLPTNLPPTLFAADLVSLRDEPFAAPLAQALSLHVQGLQIGASPGLREVLAAYAAYFDLFSAPPPRQRSRIFTLSAPSPAAATPEAPYRRLWARAETLHQSWLLARQARLDYVSSLERRLFPPAAPSSPSSPPLPLTPLHRRLPSLAR